MHEPLDDFLEPGVPCESSDSLRQALRTRTTGIVRWRRRFKKLSWAGALAACFMAGMATMYALDLRGGNVAEPVREMPTVAIKKVEPAPTEPPPKPAKVIEQEARAQPERQVAQLRKAGAMYLEQEQDYAAALRCYAQALDGADDRMLEISSSDTWLEMALKNARRKEKARAH
jgi:hypothetical protein